MNQHWFKPYSNTQESKFLEDETIDTAFYIDDYKNDHKYFSNSPLSISRANALQKAPSNYEIDLKTVSIEKGGLLDLIRSDTLYVKQEEGADVNFYIPSKSCDDKNSIDYLFYHFFVSLVEHLKCL